ncbi:hypothetical protein BDP55DRAFT_631402 [Colletotrichum godetiae]|uniref:Uncharacterized protein n=1 Tax=Colletotrichum godetiae TaxID=1209918 RepID=A0AAJ0EYH5_9PEZI|nr:uncharacterized protein BDP55DRAFT_631402 [Colletotrichum godetiae]KAK1676240.1 hypothetical protein BDP55DRAFT_631402 [Colletotrichum godetiae]
MNCAVSSEGRCPHARWFHYYCCEKICDACVQEPANIEAAKIGFACQQWGDHRVAVPLQYMPSHSRGALSQGRVDANGEPVGPHHHSDTFSTDAQASSSSSQSQALSSGTSGNGPEMISRLRKKPLAVNRMYGSLMLPPPNSLYAKVIGLERKDNYYTNSFDAVGFGGRTRDSSELWNRVSPYGSIGAEMDIYRNARLTLPPTPEFLGHISETVQASIRASEAHGGQMRAPSPVPRPSMSQEELYARGLADSWVQKRQGRN